MMSLHMFSYHKELGLSDHSFVANKVDILLSGGGGGGEKNIV